jgi:hypothetical protein
VLDDPHSVVVGCFGLAYLKSLKGELAQATCSNARSLIEEAGVATSITGPAPRVGSTHLALTVLLTNDLFASGWGAPKQLWL